MENKYLEENIDTSEPYKAEDSYNEQFEREYYEPAILNRTTNIIGWSVAGALFIIAAWLLWVALK